MKGKTRLHFNKRGVVDEAKNTDSGATHTPKEFAAEERHQPMCTMPGCGKRHARGHSG